MYKIYAESFRDEAHLKQIQQEAQDAIAGVFEDVKAPGADNCLSGESTEGFRK